MQVLGLQSSSLLPSLLVGKSYDSEVIRHVPNYTFPQHRLQLFRVPHVIFPTQLCLSILSNLGRVYLCVPNAFGKWYRSLLPRLPACMCYVSQNLLHKPYQTSALLTYCPTKEVPQAHQVASDFFEPHPKKSNALDWSSQPGHFPSFFFIRNVTQKNPWFIFDQGRCYVAQSRNQKHWLPRSVVIYELFIFTESGHGQCIINNSSSYLQQEMVSASFKNQAALKRQGQA